MNAEISLKNNKITIKITKNGKEIGKFLFKESRNLSDVLLLNLDRILKQNKISKKELEIVCVKSILPNSYTSTRIMKSLEKSFNFALKNK